MNSGHGAAPSLNARALTHGTQLSAHHSQSQALMAGAHGHVHVICARLTCHASGPGT